MLLHIEKQSFTEMIEYKVNILDSDIKLIQF